MTIQLRPVRPGDTEALEAWFDLIVAVDDFRVPDFPPSSRLRHMRMYEHMWPGMTVDNALLWDGDQAIGFAGAVLPMLENLNTAFVEIMVHPDHVRRGHGTRLLDEIYAIARRHNRTMLEFIVPVPVAGGGPVDGSGAAFAAKLADKAGLINVRRHLTVGDDIDLDALTAEAWTHADGYELRQWSGVSPDDMVSGIAALESRLLLDAPTGDLVVEPEVYDDDRMRGMENTRIARGSRLYTTVAIHVASGQVVANTLMTVDVDIPDHAWQQITIVDPAHRGHRLGLLVKVANQTYVLENEPGVTTIDTFNASTNDFMISVNEQLGFRAAEAWHMFQIPVPTKPGRSAAGSR